MQVSKRQTIKEGLQLDSSEMNDYQKKLVGWEGDGFDLRVHISDPKTGQLLKFQPYRRVVSQEGTFYFRKDEHGHERRFSESGLPLDNQDGKAKANDKVVSK